MSKYYVGFRTKDGCKVEVRTTDYPNQGRPLALRNDLRNHSPDGANWGYSGSGPAQLALGLCADALGDDEEALDVYERFKSRVIAGISTDEWHLSEEQVLFEIEEILKDERA